MFYRYISENFENYVNKNERDARNINFSYADMDDKDAELAKDDLVKTKGYFIFPSELFFNVRENALNDENLNEALEKIFSDIEQLSQGTPSEKDFKILFSDIDVNSNKLGSTVTYRNQKIVKIMNRIGDMKLGDYQGNTIEEFGDAYEFLMGMYASNASISRGEYFTPQEVSELFLT